MVSRDLRTFLEALEKEAQLLRVTEPVMPEPDIGAAASAANKGIGDTAPALMFENIQGFTDAKLVTNVHGSWPKIDYVFLNTCPPLHVQLKEGVKMRRERAAFFMCTT